MITRRQFFKIGMAGTMLVLTSRFGSVTRVVHAAIPGGTLTPGSIPKYVTPLLIPPVMPRAGTIPRPGGKNIEYYEISVRQFQQQILPASLPPTTVWGYGAVARENARGLLLHNAPSLTIEAQWDQPVRVKWINELRANPADPASAFLPHLLPVDQTLHWANPPGGAAGRDTRPTFTATPPSYGGPVPMVPHVHGSEGVGDESDGYAEAWYLPVAGNIPAGYATEGTWYEFFAGKASQKFGVSWGAGFATFQYPNTQRASTIWYHDHTLGMTRLNVYAGPAGFYIVRGGPDDVVIDSRTGRPGLLPGPAPRAGDKFPPDKTTAYYEIPLAIQDRSFNSDGSLFYPDTRRFFTPELPDDFAFMPGSDISPIWNPEFFGNCMMVNGNTWPFLDVEQRRYRFRLLNGCNSRFLILDFGAITGVDVWMIGNEGGFLQAPVHLTGVNNNRLLLGPAERADLIVDFTGVPAGSYVLGNIGPDEPFGGGIPGGDFTVADQASTGQVMQFRVGPARGRDRTTPPQFLQLPTIAALPAPSVTRPLALVEKMSMDFEDTPSEALLGRVGADNKVISNAMGGHPGDMWMDPVTENPEVGAVETWEFYNTTADAHPMHIHEVFFQLVNRQNIDISVGEDESITVGLAEGSVAVDPELWEQGWKDTVIAYPGQVTRVKMRFATAGQFVWHCHIVEHEDNEMMRPYRIGPAQPGQPSSMAISARFAIAAAADGSSPYVCRLQ